MDSLDIYVFLTYIYGAFLIIALAYLGKLSDKNNELELKYADLVFKAYLSAELIGIQENEIKKLKKELKELGV